MEFNLLGEKVIISQEREEYNKYRLRYEQEAARALQQFQTLYKNNTSLEMVVKNVPDQIMTSIYPTIKLSVQILVEQGVLTIDEDRFYNMYSEYIDSWEEAYQEIYDQYADITMTEEEKDQYRVARRKGRGKWQGGGFNVSSALKGAATAGALNMATGAAHMMFNGVAKIGSSIMANSKMNKIFHNPRTAASLNDAVWAATFVLHIALIDCLNRMGATNTPAEGVVTQEDVTKAKTIIKNISLVQDPDKQRQALLQAFELNPYQDEWYAAALDQMGDPNGDLENVGNYFGISAVHTMKVERLRKFATSFSLDTEEKALKAQEEVNAFRNNIRCFDDVEEVRAISQAVQKFDEEARTVEGTLLPTREEAAVARNELKEILLIEQSVPDGCTFNELVAAEQKLQQYTSVIGKKHFEVLHKKRIAWENELRTVDPLLPNCPPILCMSAEEAEAVRASVQTLHTELTACGEGQKAEEPLKALKIEIEKMTLPAAFMDRYKKEIDSRLQQIDNALKTAAGKLHPTRERAAEVDRTYREVVAIINDDDGAGKDVSALRNTIKSAGFSDSVTDDLLQRLAIKDTFWKEQDEKARTVETLLGGKKFIFSTKEAAQQLRSIVQDLYQQLESCGQGPEAVPNLVELKAEIAKQNLPKELKAIYIAEIDTRLNRIDLQTRTFMEKVYPSAERARNASQTYDRLRQMLMMPNALKRRKKILKEALNADLPDSAVQKITAELAKQAEEKKRRIWYIVGFLVSCGCLVLIGLDSTEDPITGILTVFVCIIIVGIPFEWIKTHTKGFLRGVFYLLFWPCAAFWLPYYFFKKITAKK